MEDLQTTISDYDIYDIWTTNTSLNFSFSNLGINETVFNYYPPALLDFAAICCIVFAVVGVLGNVITIAALTSQPKLRNATTVFIVNLCIADLLFCSFSLPLSAVTFFEREWRHGDILCRLFPLMRYSNGAVSIFSVIAITFNRYVLIVHPKIYPKIYKPINMVFMVGLLWLSAFLLFSLPLFRVWGQFGYDPAVGTCSIVQLNGKSPKIYLYSIAFVLPSIVFVICYTRIYCVVRKSANKFKEEIPKEVHSTSGNISFGSSQWIFSRRIRSNDNSSSPIRRDGESTTFSGSPKKDKKELRVLKVMLVIFVTFVLCYFPVSLVKVFKKEETWPFINILGYLTVYFSNCINPVIYVVMSKEYRKAYFSLLFCNSKNRRHSRMGRREPMNLCDVPADSFKYIEVGLPKL